MGIACSELQVRLQRCERTLSFYNYKAAEGSGLGTRGEWRELGPQRQAWAVL